MTLSVTGAGSALGHVLCLGAHADDIEIGCGGTLMSLLDADAPLTVTWVVLAADGPRADEALGSAEAILARAAKRSIEIKGFRDGYLPHAGAALKDTFEELKAMVSPDLVFTHYRHDLHQDHRLISELTWNTFRDHAILEYEVPKYDGDLGVPNAFVPLAEPVCRRKIQTILDTFKTQRNKPWFTEELFRALMRLRGMECNAPSGYAEAFYARKLVLGITQARAPEGSLP